MGSSRLPLQKKDAASRWFASDQKCMRLTSTFELSLGSIWLLCFRMSALHQYYMPALAEAGVFLFGWRRSRTHRGAADWGKKLEIFPSWRHRGEDCNGGETYKLHGVRENCSQKEDKRVQNKIKAHAGQLWEWGSGLKALRDFLAGPRVKLERYNVFNARLPQAHGYSDRKTIR